MLVQKALQELDGEINRLSRIRAIVASLHSTFSPVQSYLSPSASGNKAVAPQGEVDLPAPSHMASAQTEAAAAVLPKRSYRRLRFERSSRTRRPAPPVARALGGAIPPKPVFIASGKANGPMAVMPAPASAKTRVAAAEQPSEGLDALMREVSFRRNAQRA